MNTYTQADWGDIPDGSNIASVLEASYHTVYAPFGIFEIGLPNAAGYSMIFSAAGSLIEYLPAIGPIGPLAADLADPSSSAAGSFGGDVAAVKLNVDFTDVRLVHGTGHRPRTRSPTSISSRASLAAPSSTERRARSPTIT